MADDSLFTLASAMLAAVETYYAAESVDLPARRYVSDGTPAHDFGEGDCGGGQLTAYVRRTYSVQGNVVAEQLRPIDDGVQQGAAEVELQLVRCAPTVDDEGGVVTVPSPAEIEASARAVLIDSRMVEEALYAAVDAGDLPGCSAVAIVSWTSYGPAGGLVGGTWIVRALTDG